MYNYLESSHHVTETAPINCTFDLMPKLVAFGLAIGFGVLLGLFFVFLPVVFIVELANRQSEKAEVTKTYNSLIERYYNNTLFDV